MGTVPPSTPPGGMPPYDPQTQWRVYREQQRAAWRAQRDAWKAQRNVWKASVQGAYGFTPRVPSVVGPILLIAMGVVGVLIYAGRLSGVDFAAWYGHWWPVLLIVAGLALLGEWALDMRRPVPVRRSGGFVGLLIFLAILGFAASGWAHWWGPMRANWADNDGDNFFNILGLPEHDQDQDLLTVQAPASALVQIENPRGDISITAGDEPRVQVQAHQIAFANSETDAQKIFAAEAAHVSVTGNTVLVKSDSNSSGRVNFTVTVPKGARVQINSGHGDVTVAGLGGGANISANRGDVHLSAIEGSVQVHFSGDKGDLSAHQIGGDLTVDGNRNDVTYSEIKGKITQNGEIFGDVHMENVTGPIHLHTSVTDLEVGSLTGDLTLNSDDLHVADARGQVRIATRSKDVDLSQIAGDTYVEDRNGRIAVEPAGNFSIEAKNSKGDVEVTLPASVSACISARTRNGDIVSDFALPQLGDGENKSVTMTLGSGKAHIVLSAENGDVHLKRGSQTSVAPQPPAPPAAPGDRKAPHLRAPKTAAEPVTQ